MHHVRPIVPRLTFTGCGHCKKLAPEFIEAAKLIEEKKMDAKLAEVNCDIEKDLCSEHKIQGYPTLKVFL